MVSVTTTCAASAFGAVVAGVGEVDCGGRIGVEEREDEDDGDEVGDAGIGGC